MEWNPRYTQYARLNRRTEHRKPKSRMVYISEIILIANMEGNIMRKALWISRNLEIYVHVGRLPRLDYQRNLGMLIASKQKNSPYVFCVKPDDLEYLE